jgi:hypothetical protein
MYEVTEDFKAIPLLNGLFFEKLSDQGDTAAQVFQLVVPFFQLRLHFLESALWVSLFVVVQTVHQMAPLV